MSTAAIDRVVAAIESAADEAVAFTQELIRVPTVNPPGEAYEECARLIGERLAQCRFEVEYFAAEGRPEHTSRHPRINVVGTRPGRGRGRWSTSTATSTWCPRVTAGRAIRSAAPSRTDGSTGAGRAT